MILKNLLFTLKRQKTATLLNMIGLSCALAVFSICLIQVSYELGYNRCHSKSSHIYQLISYAQQYEDYTSLTSYPRYNALQEASPHITAATAFNNYGNLSLSFNEGEEPNEYPVNSFQKEASQMFGYKMIEGTFESVEQPGTLLIPESMARAAYGSEPACGKVLYTKTAGVSYTVGGVFEDLPDNNLFGNNIVQGISKSDDWSNGGYYGFFLLDTDDTQTVLQEMAHALYKNSQSDLTEDEFVKDFTENSYLGSLSESHFGRQLIYDIDRNHCTYLFIFSLMSIALVVLLIAIINYINFQMATVPMRIRSINTQKVFGASNLSLRLTLITEGAGWALLSFLLSIIWMYLLDKTPLHDFISTNILPENNIPAMLLLLCIALCTGIVAALYPTFFITSFRPILTLKGSFGSTPKGRLLRNILVIFQYTASFTLISMALLMNEQIRYMIHAPKGYESERLIVYSMPRHDDVIRDRSAQLEERLRSYPYILGTSTCEDLVSGENSYMGWGRIRNGEIMGCEVLVVFTPDFLKTLGITLTDGRDFDEMDMQNENGALIFNETARKKYNLELGENIDPGSIVGFMNDINYSPMNKAIGPMCIWMNARHHFGKVANFGYVRVDTGTDMSEARRKVEEEIKQVDPNYNGTIQFVDEALESSYQKEQKIMRLMLICSLIAVLISLAGVFGMINFENQYRRKEIGIRKIMGETSRSVLAGIHRIYLRILCIGFILSVPITVFAFDGWLTDFAYRTAIPVWVFLASLLTLTLITVVMITLQSWKTANSNPIDSIKAE